MLIARCRRFIPLNVFIARLGATRIARPAGRRTGLWTLVGAPGPGTFRPPGNPALPFPDAAPQEKEPEA